MTITLNTPEIIYAVVAIFFAIVIAIDVFKPTYGSGGWFSTSKPSGEIGLFGVLMALCFLLFSLIWGGIFWW